VGLSHNIKKKFFKGLQCEPFLLCKKEKLIKKRYMKNLIYFKNKYEKSKTQVGRDSAKKNAEEQLNIDDFKKFLQWETTQPDKPKRIR
jgi:hypothetical protein